MPFIEANGLTYRYRITGEGPPILILRGLVRCLDFWLEFEPAMREHFTVICVDNRGVGGTDAPRGLYSTASMADDTAAVLRGLGYDKVDLFGISLGGMIAQQLLIRHPSLFRKAVLGCTQPGGRRAKKPAKKVLAKLASAMFMEERAGNRMSLPLVLSDDYLERHPEIEDRWYELLCKYPVQRHVFAAQLAAAATHRAAKGLQHVQTPTLLLSGNADRLIPAENTALLDELLPDSRVEWIVGAGHDFPTEAPDETARLIAAFLID